MKYTIKRMNVSQYKTILIYKNIYTSCTDMNITSDFSLSVGTTVMKSLYSGGNNTRRHKESKHVSTKHVKHSKHRSMHPDILSHQKTRANSANCMSNVKKLWEAFETCVSELICCQK